MASRRQDDRAHDLSDLVARRVLRGKNRGGVDDRLRGWIRLGCPQEGDNASESAELRRRTQRLGGCDDVSRVTPCGGEG